VRCCFLSFNSGRKLGSWKKPKKVKIKSNPFTLTVEEASRSGVHNCDKEDGEFNFFG
jgi:hypothetical protein